MDAEGLLLLLHVPQPPNSIALTFLNSSSIFWISVYISRFPVLLLFFNFVEAMSSTNPQSDNFCFCFGCFVPLENFSPIRRRHH